MFARFAGVGGEGLIGVEVLVALDRKAERPAKIAQLVHAHESELLGPS